jgi:hypothetical protein
LRWRPLPGGWLPLVLTTLDLALDALPDQAQRIGWAKPAFSDDIADTIRNIGKLTTIAEREIHATVLSCARARRQRLAAMPALRSVSR